MQTAGKLHRIESLRGFAGIYVAVGHILNVHFGNPPWGLLGRFAAEVVILFFLISGFVIRYTTRDETSIAEYLFKRFRRIYPLFFLTLILSWGFCSLAERQLLPFNLPQFLGNVFMLQDFGFKRPGVWIDCFHNVALWSLSYECWFYLFFIPLLKWKVPLNIKTATVYAISLACAGMYFVYPSQFGWFGLYFSVWWAGALLADEYRNTGKVTLLRHLPSVAVLSLISLIFCIPLLNMPRAEWEFGLFPLIDIRRFAAAAAIIVIGCLWRGTGWCGFAWTFGPFMMFAPLTYGLYILHFPVLVLINAQPWASNHLLFLVVCVPLLLLIAYLAEVVLQSAINRWTEPWLVHIKAKYARNSALITPAPPAT